MKSTTRRSIFLAAGALLLATSAWAQLGTVAKFEVPFAFDANGMSMPAGEYRLFKSGQAAVLRSFDAKIGIFTLWQSKWAREYTHNCRLVFLKTGDHYVLKSGEIPGFVTQWRVDKHTMAIQAKAGTPEVVILAKR